MRKGLLSFLLFVVVGLSAVQAAYDFSVVVPSGQTLYFSITSNSAPYEVGVTYPASSSYPFPYSGYTEPTGNLVIPDTVTYQGISYSVTSIGNYAFEDCSGLTSVTIPNSVTSIGDVAFDFCTSLTSVTIPNSVTSIGNGAFRNCSGLTSVTIPNSVTSIGSSAFSGCSGLTSVIIPNSVTSIGSYAFYNVRLIIYNGTATGSPWGALLVNGYIEGDFVYANNTKTSLLAYIGTSTSVTIPNSVTSIGEGAFYNCSGLTSVTIPNSVTSIGNYAFEYCSGLTTLNFNAINCGNFSSSYHPFNNCPITTINIGDSVQRIPRYFAYNLDSLTSVTIPNSVTSIGSSAFDGCSGLTSVTIGNSVTIIGFAAFDGCSGLTSVTIPNSVTSIENGTFSGCSGLTTLNFNAINCGNFSSSYHPFNNCPITTINIGDSVQRIPAYFAYNRSSLSSITIPNSVTSIGRYAFDGCSGLTSVTIPNSVTSIGEGAFYNCSGLTSATIGNSVTNIGFAAFGGCSGLTSVTIPNSVTSIESYAFDGCSGLTTLNFNAINCGDFSGSYHPFGNCPIATINIGDSVQQIPAYFACNLESLTSVTIPNSVTSIEDGTFYGCSGLTSVTIPNSVTSIGWGAFKGCTGLTSVTIPNSVTTIGKSAFTDCGHLASATISSGINRIEESTFENCTSLVTITIPSNVANIEGKAFNGCSSLHEVISLAVLPPSLGEEIFSATAILKVPCGSADYYNSAASDWTQYFVGIEEICNVTITVTSANENMGTVSGGGEYEFGTEVTITATPNQGCRFVSWNDGNTDNPRTITVTEDATYIASFEESVGIENIDMLSELAFYPNPTSGIITFKRSDIMKVEVLDAMGKMVAVYENAYTIDISKLAKGYYAMRITTPEGVAVRKVVRK